MGGSCEASMTTDSEMAMIEAGMAHVEAAHPELAAQVKAMSPEEQNAWSAEFHTKWEAQPEDTGSAEVAGAAPEVAPEGETPMAV